MSEPGQDWLVRDFGIDRHRSPAEVDGVARGVAYGVLGQPAHCLIGSVVGGLLHGATGAAWRRNQELLANVLTWPAVTQLVWVVPLVAYLRARGAPRTARGVAYVAAFVALGNSLLVWLGPEGS